ncbi:MAG: TetR/AcrR family transcriptional regulator [Proteobacteria bacterium]|nr:TetR/AcrR family transcriptional regulator [Pseudomonadota bacterium]
MGRRSTHTPEQLRQLILDAAQSIIEADGLVGLSAREIARRIGYSPGTIYNMFQNLDDVVLHIEARVLDQLDQRLTTSLEAGAPEERVSRLAEAYLKFTHERPKLWNLLFEHYMPAGAQTPTWYQQKLELLMSRVEEAMAPLFPPDATVERQRAARVLWAGVHGITSLATANKLSNVTTEAANLLVRDLIKNYLAGVAAGRKG